MAITLSQSFTSHAADYLGEYSVYDKGLKLFTNVQIIAIEIFKNFKCLKAVSVCQNLFNALDLTRTVINIPDFVGDVAGMNTDTSIGDGHVGRMNIASSAFFFIADTISPFLFFAEFGFYAVEEVLKKGLSTAAAVVGIVGSCVVIASSCYQIYNAQDIVKNALTLAEKTLDCAAGILFIASVAVFPPGLIIISALYVTSSSIALVKIWLF